MQTRKLKASNFAMNSGHPLVTEGNQLKYPQNHPKTPLYLQTGDPTKFGFEQVKMPQRGYEILKEKIKANTNHGYGPSNGLKSTRAAVAEAFSGEDYKLTDDDVIICNGGGIALMQMMMGLVNPGENILIPSVGFPYYQGFSKAMDIELRGYKLLPEQSWEIDLVDLEKKVDANTKFLYIINPSNPCGSVFSKGHILDILSLCSRLKVPIVADEIYWNMVYPGVEFHAFGHLTTDVPVITMMALDKAFLVPGWAMGWLMFYDKTKVFTKAKEGLLALSQIYLHPNTFIQHALIGILQEIGLDFIKKDIMPLFETNRDLMMKELKEIQGLIPIKPYGSIFMSVIIEMKHFPEFKTDKEFLQSLINEENISAFPLSSFAFDSPEIQGFRLLACANEAFYRDFFQRLGAFCSRFYKNL